jgi:hypothetical protein
LLVVASYSDRYFAWTISVRPTSAFLGAAYAAGFVLAVLALRRHRWRDVRVALVTVTVFTMLTLVPTLIHLHTFHLMDGGFVARVAAWFWLAVYLVIPVACVAMVVDQQRQPTTGSNRVRRPMPSWLTFLLAVQGGTLLTVGTALFVGGATVHHFPADAMSFWPWRLTPLGAQVVGAWLVALARGGVDDLGTGPGAAPGSGGNLQRLRRISAAGHSSVLGGGQTRLPMDLGLRCGARLHRRHRCLRLLGSDAQNQRVTPRSPGEGRAGPSTMGRPFSHPAPLDTSLTRLLT